MTVVPVAFAPSLPSLSLSDEEQDLLARLQQRFLTDLSHLDTLDAYYEGRQRMTSLGIALPPELAGLRTAIGWPQLVVDAVHERLDVEGFRYPGTEEADGTMWEVWQRNDLDSEAPHGFLDALVHGRSHIVVGSAEDSDVPLVTVESARNLVYEWDARKRAVRAALQLYTDGDDQFATLFLPDQTIELSRDGAAPWQIDNRDQHRVGWTPVLPLVNRARVHDRHGKSEITPVIRDVTDAACRAMLRMEVGAEFFSTPQRYMVGASMQDFVDADGNAKTAWETYIGRFLMLEPDADGERPEVGQFSAADPSAHTRVLEFYGRRVAEEAGLPLTYVALSSDNPSSADAIRMSTDRLVQRAKRKHRAFEGALEGAMRAALAFQKGSIPDQAQLIETIWRKPEIPTPAATTDAVVKQIEAGYLAPGSDLAGEAFGYTPLQRQRAERERKKAAGADALNAIMQRVGAAPAGQPGQAPGTAQKPVQPGGNVAGTQSLDLRSRHDIPGGG